MITAFIFSACVSFSSVMFLLLLGVAYTFFEDGDKARDVIRGIGLWGVRILVVSVVLMYVTLILAPVPKFWNVY